jgi:hypothetical protein
MALVGDVKNALRAVDTLLVYNQKYFQNDYGSMADNASHITACFYRYDTLTSLMLVDGYCQKKKISLEEFYARFWQDVSCMNSLRRH